MRIMKYLLSLILIFSICFICSPSESVAKTTDVNMFVHQKLNCDPKMLIKGNPNIDPGILLNSQPKNALTK